MEMNTKAHQPLISVIIPCYNSELTIAACLGSIAAQTFRDLEIVVVDGLSSDGTMAEVRKFAGSLPSLTVVSERDSGIYDAMNKGVKLARGSWVYLLGSDDRVYNPDTLERVAQRLRQSDAGVVYGDVRVRGDLGPARDGEIYGGEFPLRLLLRRNICQQAIFYRRTLFQTLGAFNIDYRIWGDWDFNLRCAARSTLEYMDVVVAEYSGGGTSSLQKEGAKFYEEFAPNLYRYFGLRVFGKAFRTQCGTFWKSAHMHAQQRKLLRAALFFSIAIVHRVLLGHFLQRFNDKTSAAGSAMQR